MTLGLFYVVVKMPGWTFWGGLIWLLSLIAIHSVRDHNYKRDYASEPVTAAESMEGIVETLVNHLESTSHEEGDCDPCPVPELLSKLRLTPLNPDPPRES